MYITPERYAETFRTIKRTSLSHSTCKLVVFVSCLDVDSLCAAKILSLLFRKELIQYQLIPVVGYSDLKQHYSRLDDEVSNVILVGCGAMLDLEGFFDIDPDALVEPSNQSSHINDDLRADILTRNGIELRRKIYIIDGHRPWSLDNVFGSAVVVCFDDGYIDANLQSQKSAYTDLVENEESEDDSGQSETSETDEDEDEDDEINGDREDKNNGRDVDENEIDGEVDENRQVESQIDGDDENVNLDDQSRKRIHSQDSGQAKRQRRQRHLNRNTLQEYYNQGTTVMTAASAMVYGFLALVGETSLDNLWLAIIGTSSLDSQYPEVYDKLQPIYKDEVLRLNPSNVLAVSERTADTTLLSVETDYHLFLLRHWTLYDLFFYLSHVNAKLNLWTEDGKKKLHKMFAKMGVLLAVAQQKWLYMDTRVKKKLPVIFGKYLPMYGLEGIVRDGFVRTWGFAGQLSAMESVEALTALLELDKRLLRTEAHEEAQDAEAAAIEDDERDSDARINERIDRKEKAWVNNFWSLWDALGPGLGTKGTRSKGLDLLLDGLEHAKEIQQVVFRTGMSLLERRMVKNMRTYRLCVLNDGLIPDLKIFNNPLMLQKLGGWLVENITELDFMNNKRSLKPFVVASLDVASDSYLVIGLAPRYPRGMDNTTRARLAQQREGEHSLTMRLNTFSVVFQQLAATSGAKVRIDSFDSSVIEIRKDDLAPFLEKLASSQI